MFQKYSFVCCLMTVAASTAAPADCCKISHGCATSWCFTSLSFSSFSDPTCPDACVHLNLASVLFRVGSCNFFFFFFSNYELNPHHVKSSCREASLPHFSSVLNKRPLQGSIHHSGLSESTYKVSSSDKRHSHVHLCLSDNPTHTLDMCVIGIHVWVGYVSATLNWIILLLFFFTNISPLYAFSFKTLDTF